MLKELKYLKTAILFYTRIPCGEIKDYDPDDLNRATRYFPFIGWIVGIVMFVIFWLMSMIVNVYIATAISLLAGVLVTGGFHEDGLADAFDGFGGGWTKERILEIMKDSRIGSYGVLALIFDILLKYLLLCSLLNTFSFEHTWMLALFFISYHSLARLVSCNLIFFSRYARMDATSKVKPIGKECTWKEFIGASLFGLLPLAVFAWHTPLLWCVAVPLFLFVVIAKHFFEKHIDGFTGDCLGAVEQIAELTILLSFAIIWNFI